MIATIYNYFMQHIEIMVPMVIIMMSSLIVFMGILKKVVFNRITNKHIRCVVLSATSVVLSFASVALGFLIKDYDWQYYWMCCGIYTCGVIVVYWLYENTQLREGISKIGNYVLNKTFNTFAEKVNKIAENTEEAIQFSFAKIENPATVDKKDEFKNL